MLIEKGDLLKVLRAVSSFDVQACPFLAIQFPAGDKPQFHRSSNTGYIQTKDYDPMVQGRVFASLENLKTLLNVSADTMEMAYDNAGLRLVSTDEYPVRLQVYIVREQVAGWTYHNLGNPNHYRFDPKTFEGFDIRPFKNLTALPALQEGRLLIITLAGAVLWTGPEVLKTIKVHPRESFLRFIGGGDLNSDILISLGGYWIAERDGLVMAQSVHAYRPENDIPKELYSTYNVPGTELARYNASRLVSAFDNVAYLTADTDKIELNPKDGVVCRDKYTNVQTFPLGPSATQWPKAYIYGRTAKFIVDALGQTSEEEAVLYSVPSRNAMYRIVRGNFEVNFGLV